MKDFVDGRLTFNLYDAGEDKTTRFNVANLVENPDAQKIEEVRTALAAVVDLPIQRVTYTQNYIVN